MYIFLFKVIGLTVLLCKTRLYNPESIRRGQIIFYKNVSIFYLIYIRLNKIDAKHISFFFKIFLFKVLLCKTR
jgi:hypothetical protein